MAKYRYFKCNVLGGFRLSDLNKNVKQGEYFFVDGHVAETSRAVIAATRERWMIEVSEKEASKHVEVPREVAKGGVQPAQIRKKGAVNQSSNVAIPDVSEVNKNLESRQATNNKLDQVATPNIDEVSKRAEEKVKEQKSNKVIIPSKVEKAATAKQSEEDKASLPDFKKVEEKQKAERDTTTTSDEDIAKQADMEVIPSPAIKKAEEKEAKKEEVKEEKKETVEVKKDEVVSSLSNDEVFDNTQLATPNFDEKETKTEVKKDLEKKIQRKKKKADTKELEKKKRKYTRRKKETESVKE